MVGLLLSTHTHSSPCQKARRQEGGRQEEKIKEGRKEKREEECREEGEARKQGGRGEADKKQFVNMGTQPYVYTHSFFFIHTV